MRLILFLALVGLFFVACQKTPEQENTVIILHPLPGALFPRDFRSPLFRWQGVKGAQWRLSLNSAEITTTTTFWRPSRKLWESIKTSSLTTPANFTVTEVKNEKNRSTVTFSTSKDPVGAPLFYREVPLPVIEALNKIEDIRWLLADLSKDGPPRTVLEKMKTCANCHSFSADGSTLAMDMDHGGDKGSFLIKDISKTMRLKPDDMISWSKLYPKSKRKTFGLLATLSPDARYSVATVEEVIVYQLFLKKYVPQLFFPVVGHLAVYDRQTKEMKALSGADSQEYVQTNPSFSPSGEKLLFARAKAIDTTKFPYPHRMPAMEQKGRFVHGKEKFCFDIYELDFNEGKGSKAHPLKGASKNGKSNYFPRYSPDGKWLVFCQANRFMLNQPDATLYIKAVGSDAPPKKMGCNFANKMNSWHSFSPNSKWLVFAAKAEGPYTQLWITHVDENGNDSVPIHLDGSVLEQRAANIPEFVAMDFDDLKAIEADGL